MTPADNFDQFDRGEALAARVKALEDKALIMHDELQKNTAITTGIKLDTAELVAIFGAAKTGTSAFVWFGKSLQKLVQFAYPFVLIAAAVWALMHGKWPKWPE